MRLRVFTFLLVLALIEGREVRADQTAAAAKPVSYPMKVAGQGKDVRVRRVYRTKLGKLGDGPLMPNLGVVSKDNYENIKGYVKEIMTQWPPDKYYYVGVGRSASPIIAMLKNLGPDLAANFPSSDMSQEGGPLFEKYPENYRAHIEALIPATVRTGNRKLLLIDYSSGKSPKGLKGVFDAYRAAGGAMPEIDLVGVGWGVGNGLADVPAINITSNGTDFTHERDKVAEFIGEYSDNGHQIHSQGGTLSALRRNPVYAEHRRALYQRMKRDKDLDQFLRKTFPKLVRRKPQSLDPRR